MLDTVTIQRFENALPIGFSALKELAINMASEGMSQAAICHAFDSFGRYLRDTGRDQFERGVIGVSIECIVGDKSRDSWWFNHYLTQEEFDEYRRTIGAPLRTIFHFDGQSHVNKPDA